MTEKPTEYEKKVMASLEAIQKNTEKKEESSKPVEKEGEDHHSIDDIVDCPNCYPELSEKVIKKELKDATHECIGCGLPVRGEESGKEEWKCKNCGEEKARPKERE